MRRREVTVQGEPAGQQFGEYRVVGPLASGRMGEVVRAHDAEHGRDVALEVLHPSWAGDQAYRQRFLQQARIALRLTEPHLVPIHRYGEVDGRLFVDMRLVEGEDVATLVRRTGPLDPARAVDLTGQVARALDAAHAAGLVHGRLTAADVLLAGPADGGDVAGEDVALLAGLGVAPPPDPAQEGAPDAGADIAGLAGVLYQLLTARPPVPAAGPTGSAGPPAPSRLRPGLPEHLDGVVLRGLTEDRDQRWTSAGGMAAAARAALSLSGVEVSRPAEHPGALPPGGAADRPGRATARRWAAALPLLVLGAACGARAWWTARRR